MEPEFSEDEIVMIHHAYALLLSSNASSPIPLGWLQHGWEDAHHRYWEKRR
jgi:hypothetical protein